MVLVAFLGMLDIAPADGTEAEGEAGSLIAHTGTIALSTRNFFGRCEAHERDVVGQIAEENSIHVDAAHI